MGDVYRRAGRVLVWLGKEKRSRAHALPFVEAVAPTIAQRQANGLWGPGIRPSAINNPSGWHALSWLTRQPWFNRAWVQQEIGVAKDALAYYGGDPVRGPHSPKSLWPSSMIRIWPLQRNTISRQMKSSFTARNSEPAATPARVFLEVLQLYHNRQCKDPKDKVFAFLGHPSACPKSSYRLYSVATIEHPEPPPLLENYPNVAVLVRDL